MVLLSSLRKKPLNSLLSSDICHSFLISGKLIKKSIIIHFWHKYHVIFAPDLSLGNNLNLHFSHIFSMHGSLECTVLSSEYLCILFLITYIEFSQFFTFLIPKYFFVIYRPSILSVPVIKYYDTQTSFHIIQ